jgi:hypothetical protein
MYDSLTVLRDIWTYKKYAFEEHLMKWKNSHKNLIKIKYAK